MKPGTALKIFGWLSAISVMAGSFFRMNYWPGGAQLIILGSLLFALFYLPLWVSAALKENEGKIIKIIQFFTLFLYILTGLWKTMHWPGAGVFYIILSYYTLLFLIPYSFYLLIRTGKNSLSRFHFIIIIMIIVSNSTSSLSRSVSGNVVEGFAQSNILVERSLKRTQTKNVHLYSVFDLINEKNTVFQQNAKTLKKLSDSAADYVHSLRNYFVSKLEGISEAAADSLSGTDILKKANYDIGNSILIGDPNNPNSGTFSAIRLKHLLEWYRDTVVKLIQSENKEFITAGINLDTKNGEDNEGQPVNWVIYTFYNIPAISNLSTLTGIENEIRNTETQILSDLLNGASRSSSANLAVQIADIGEKLEKEKKEKEIAVLQKENEMNELRMNAKNAELDSANKVIVLFVVGVIVFIVLLFFIIRSNILRKRINRELEEQKKLIEEQKEKVEEKQREIIDSIKYALRIQKSLLPSDQYIQKNIGRLGEKSNI